jgi:hypothetical protein
MAFERADRLAALQVPESQRVVARSRDGTAAVGRQHHGVDRVRMAFERPKQRTSGRIKTGGQRPKPKAKLSI